MATLDKIKVGGVDYDIVDSQARQDIETLKGGSANSPFVKGAGDDTAVLNGSSASATKRGAVAMSQESTASGYFSFTQGYKANAENDYQASFGYNSVTTQNDNVSWGGDNTLFVVGNGNLEKHNALEVRANGDVYISDTNAEGTFETKPMIKLQDKIKELEDNQGGSHKSITILVDEPISKGKNIEIDGLRYADELLNLSVGDEIIFDYVEELLVHSEVISINYEMDSRGGTNPKTSQEIYIVDNYGQIRKYSWGDTEHFVTVDPSETDLSNYYTKVVTDSLLKEKQNKLGGDYVKDVEIGGGYITFNSMKFDGNNNGVKTANFKTINNQPILGAGNIEIKGGEGSAKEWTVEDLTKVTNTELPFKEVNVGDVIKTTNDEDIKYFSIVSKEDSTNEWGQGVLTLINSKEKSLVTLNISLGTLDQPWGSSYYIISTNIGGANITTQSIAHGSSSNYIYSEGDSGSTKNAISRIWVDQFGVDNGVRINSTFWGGDAVGQPVDILCANPWGMNGVMSSADKSKLDSMDMDGLKLKKITQSEFDNLENKDSNTLYVIYG